MEHLGWIYLEKVIEKIINNNNNIFISLYKLFINAIPSKTSKAFRSIITKYGNPFCKSLKNLFSNGEALITNPTRTLDKCRFTDGLLISTNASVSSPIIEAWKCASDIISYHVLA